MNIESIRKTFLRDILRGFLSTLILREYSAYLENYHIFCKWKERNDLAIKRIISNAHEKLFTYLKIFDCPHARRNKAYFLQLSYGKYFRHATWVFLKIL